MSPTTYLPSDVTGGTELLSITIGTTFPRLLTNQSLAARHAEARSNHDE